MDWMKVNEMDTNGWKWMKVDKIDEKKLKWKWMKMN